MSLQVHPMRQIDFDTLITHASHSYPGDDLVAPPNPLTWPVTTRQEARLRLEKCMEMQRRRFMEDPTCQFMKVVHVAHDASDEAEIVSIARWHRYPYGYDYSKEAHWELAAEDRDQSSTTVWPANFNSGAHDEILTQRDAFRERWIPKGRPIWLLMHLVTRPTWRGQGAASMLIRWGQEQAAKEDTRVYLESGAGARHIYEQNGFKVVGDLRSLDMRSWGLEAPFELANMVWTPPSCSPDTQGLQ